MRNKKLSFSDLAEDYAIKPIPAEISVSGFRISLINTALAFSLPTLLLGAQLSTTGAKQAVSAFIWGGLILAIIGTVAGIVGLRNRISTYMLMRFSFGLQGAKIVNICMALSMFGWFGVNVYLFGQAASGLCLSLSGSELKPWVFVLMGGLLMTAGAVFGFKSIQKLALFIVPIQVLIFVILLNLTFSDTTLQELLGNPVQNQITQGKAISAVVGSFIVAAVVMPDFTRYGKTWWDAVIASFIPYFFASTFAYTIATFAAMHTGKSDILELMQIIGLGMSAFVLVIFSSWITNSVNLYGCSLSIASIFPKLHEWQIAILSGMVGTVVALFEILKHFIDFIFSLGIIFTPVVGIYAIDYFILHKGNYDLEKIEQDTSISYIAIISWLLGIAAAYGTNKQWLHLTGISSCDSLFVAVLSYLVLMKLNALYSENVTHPTFR